MGGNLLSISHFACYGAEMCFKGKGCKLLNQHKEVTCVGHLRRNLYIMDMTVITNEHAKIAIVDHFPMEGEDALPTALATHISTTTADLTTWH